MRRLAKQARQQGVSCYRLYDADMPEYAFAIDRYEAAGSGAVHLHVQEYAAPASVDVAAARRRRREALASWPQRCRCARADPPAPAPRAARRDRAYQRGAHGGHADAHRSATLAQPGSWSLEGGLLFLVDLDDHFDTGLFLDHRLTRALIRERRPGRAS